jgi:hypothetical protein
MTSPARRGAVAAGAAVVAAGGAVALLQVLQQAIGVFDPRPEISLVIVVAAFLAGLVAARLRTRRKVADEQAARAASLGELFVLWPSAAEADPLRLGVFPPRRDIGAEHYVSRAGDQLLRGGLVPGSLAVVVGEPRAGASRTALEAVRAELGSVGLLVPCGPEALQALLDLDPPLRVAGTRLTVWLDGLDRYTRVLDRPALDALLGLAAEVTVVATIRRSYWDAWMRSSGERGVAARAVAARARVFDLSAELEQRELLEARAHYPGLDFAAGVGVALTSSGREPAGSAVPETAVPADPEPVPDARPLRRDPQFLLPFVAACCAVVALAVIWIGSGFSVPSIADQLARVQRDGSGGERRPTMLGTTDLHGTGVKSHVILFRGRSDPARPRSDGLRIYDEVGDKLVLRLNFEPRPDPQRSYAVFQYRGTADVDGDGAAELIGGYAYAGSDQGRQALVPFAVNWDGDSRRYRVVPLDLGPPALSRKPATRAAAQYRRLYAAPVAFADRRGGQTLTGHRVQDFALTALPYRLVIGWFLQPWIDAAPATFEVQVAILDRTTGTPRVRPCRFPGKPLVLRAGRDRHVPDVLREAYAAASTNATCTPTTFE